MNKFLMIGAVLAVVSAPAFATKARLISLGEDASGSQYINDNRNIFLNAAYANLHKNSVILEVGGDGQSGSVNNSTIAKLDTDTTPQAEGGILVESGNLTYGFYYGAESAAVQEARRYLNIKDRLAHQDNQLDFFVAGENSVKWGVNLTYSSVENDSRDLKSDTLSARLGVIKDNIEGFLNVSLMNELDGRLYADPANAGASATNNKEKFEGKLGYELGGTYALSKGKVFGFWRHAGWDQESDESPVTAAPGPAGGVYNGKAEGQTDRFILGYGLEEKLSDKATLFTRVSYVANKREFKTATQGKVNLDDYQVPVVVGLEYDSTSWLTLRGSVSQSIVSEQDYNYDPALRTAGVVNPIITGGFKQGKRTFPSTTAVRAGATLKFGEFSIDGLVMRETGGDNGVLDTENLLTRVGMTYRF